MNMSMKKSLPIVLITAMSQIFFCCQHDSIDPVAGIGDPSTATALLSKVIHDDSLYDTYEYNDKNEVIKITTYSPHATDPLKFSRYFYDDDGKLTKREFYRQEVDYQLAAYETFDWQGNEVTNFIYILYYDGGNHKISEELYQKHIYELNERSELTRITEWQNIPNLGLINSSYTDFTWADGNVTEKNVWQLTDDGSEYLLQADVTLKYDEKLNPYHVLPHEVFIRPWLNNVIEEKDTENDLVTTYTYTYDASGYIQSALKKTIYHDDMSTLEEIRAAYEYTSPN